MRHCYFLLFTILFSACAQEKTTTTPDNLISKKEMTTILTEVSLIEGAVSKKLIDKLEQKDSPLYYKALFKKHNISSEQFEESLIFYQKNPAMLVEVYDSVIVQLSQLKAEMGDTEKQEN